VSARYARSIRCVTVRERRNLRAAIQTAYVARGSIRVRSKRDPLYGNLCFAGEQRRRHGNAARPRHSAIHVPQRASLRGSICGTGTKSAVRRGMRARREQYSRAGKNMKVCERSEPAAQQQERLLNQAGMSAVMAGSRRVEQRCARYGER